MYSSLRFLASGLVLGMSFNSSNSQASDLRANLRLIRTIDLSNEKLYGAKFTQLGELFAVTRNQATKRWAYYKGETKQIFSPCEDVNLAGLPNRDGNLFSIGCEDFSVEIWDTDTAKISTRFTARKYENSKDYLVPYLSHDGKRVVVELGERAELWDVTGSKKIADFDSSATSGYRNRSIYAVEFSPNSRVVAVAFAGKVFLWDTENGKLLHRLIDKKPDYWPYDETDQVTDVGSVRHLLFSKDSKTLVTGSSIGRAKSWDVETGQLLQRFKGHKLAMTSLALSPDEKILATGSRNQDVKLWDIATGKELFSLNNRKEVRRIIFHPAGTRLLSMTSTHAFIWERASGKLLEEMPVADVLTTSFSPDWKFVIAPDKKTKTLGLYEYVGK